MAVICAALLAGQAQARRPATQSEARAMRAGVTSYVLGSGCCIVGTRFRVLGSWVSTVQSDFGRINIATYDRSRRVGPRATVVLVHTRSGVWTVIAFGTARIACGVTPQIRRDLGLLPCG
jgi:hypothetical protein